MAKIEDDFSAFDSVAQSTDDDFSSFDDMLTPKDVGILQKLMKKGKESTDDAIDTLSSIVTPVVETGLDFSSGVAKGLSMGSLDEVGGVIGAGIETGLGKLGIGPAAVDAELAAQGFKGDVGESFGEKYRGYQQASEKAQEAAAERSPVAETLGQISGGVTGGAIMGSAIGIGKGAKHAKSLGDILQNEGKAKAALELLTRAGKTYAKAAPFIAAESALTSKEQLIGENANPKGVAADVLGSLTFAAPAVIGLEAAPDLLKLAKGKVGNRVDSATAALTEAFESENNPKLRQLAKAYNKYGKQLGVSPRSHEADIGGMKLAQLDNKNTSTVLNHLNNADTKLGQEVGESLLGATKRGAMVDINPEIQAASQRISDIAQEIPTLGQSRRSAVAYEKMLSGETQLTPNELKHLIDDIDSSIGIFKSASNKNPAEAATLSELINFRKSISNTLKQAVPEYRDAARRFESFREVLEQIVSKDKPGTVTEKFYGKINNQQDKLFTNVRDMIENVQKTSDSNQATRTSFTNFMDALNKFEVEDAARLARDPSKTRVIQDSKELRKFMLDASDDSVLRGSSRNVAESRSFGGNIKEGLIGKAPNTAAYLAGRGSKAITGIKASAPAQSVAKVSRSVYNAPTDSLKNVASKLEASGSFKNVGKALREAIEDGNTAKKNATLFTIMQNPESRALISAEDLKEEDF